MFRLTLKSRAALALSASAFFAFAPIRTQAWNGTGHMVVASLAYDRLTPAARAAVDALLMQQRDYGMWMGEMPASYTDRARFAFMKAATWPDDVRRTPDDRPLWHYVDLPVVAAGYTPDPSAIQPVAPNAVTQLPVEETLMVNKAASDADRATAMCWVEHLVGDIHQPLHCAEMFSAQFPKGDRGGNSESLTPGALDADPVESAAHPRSFHALWDDMEGNSQDPNDILTIAARLEAPTFAPDTYPQLAADKTVDGWAHEGNTLARDDAYAYHGTALTLTPYGSKADVTLPAGYLDSAHNVADRQIALAGLRLADTLNAAFSPPAPLPATPPAAKAARPLIVGNKATHRYHVGDTGTLPPIKNRVYFATEAAARKAGYHLAGSKP